ncbi:hypothetical protein E4U42_001841 [Claviceps africana]|uniref:Rhodopsin domain-containing protein n=1 Tax=Claviceps africana TaxID=83212 RepID=A0A8K0J901_9HYPO|nr:hypothetical protein E4U42_001841 [Claviceps africana]
MGLVWPDVAGGHNENVRYPSSCIQHDETYHSHVLRASQILLRGSLKKLKLDDYLMAVIMFTDTILVVVINIISNTNSNLIDPSQPTSLSPDDILERDMTLKSNLVVKLAAGYVALGFVLMEILYLGVWCRPFNQYWTVPPISTQCSAATYHLITNAVLNVSSDIMIILIPLPVFLQSQLAIKKKIILMGVFALGVFTILSAILNKYHSFKDPFSSEWIFWYIRESSTAIIVANLPLTWTVFRRLFNLGSFNRSEYSSKVRCAKSSYISRSHVTCPRNQSQKYMNQDDVNGNNAGRSEENIAQSYGISLKIYQRHDVQVSSERAPFDTLTDALTTTTVIQGGQPREFSHADDVADADTSSADRSYPVVNVTQGV